jgi:hypothetical protein
MDTPLLLLSISACAHAWERIAPGAPHNISVAAWPHYAEVRWRHAEDSGDLPTHYVVK